MDKSNEILGCNCVVCAFEFSPQDLVTLAISNSKLDYKICHKCLDKSNPHNDYQEAKSIISSFFKSNEAKEAYSSVKRFLRKTLI